MIEALVSNHLHRDIRPDDRRLRGASPPGTIRFMRTLVGPLFVLLSIVVASACSDDASSGASSGGSSSTSSSGGNDVPAGPQPVGGRCAADDQCEGKCTGGVCAEPTTSDGKLSPSLGETDVDCGGSKAPTCTAGKGCAVDGDCATKICGLSKKCVDVRSCGGSLGPEGMTTCGSGEVGDPNAKHESCCRSLPLPTSPARSLDKYEITAGRLRTFVMAMEAENNGEPNVRKWAKQYAQDHQGSQLAQLPEGVLDILPETKTATAPLSIQVHLGMFPIDAVNRFDGCYTGTGSNGHATYWQPPEDMKTFGAGDANGNRKFSREVLDTKPINCVMPLMLAAFCAWDGGELPLASDYREVWGTTDVNVGPNTVLIPWKRLLSIGEFNFKNGTRGIGTCAQYQIEGWPGCVDADQPWFYQFPAPTSVDDDTPSISAPGRFPLDVTAITSANGEGWYDIAGDMLEASWPASEITPDPTPDLCDMTSGPGTGADYCERLIPGETEPRQGTRRFSGALPNVVGFGYSFEGHARANEAYLRTGAKPSGWRITFQYGKVSARCARATR